MKFLSNLHVRICAIALLFVLLLAPISGLIHPFVSASAADAKTILFASPAIPATVGDTVKLTVRRPTIELTANNLSEYLTTSETVELEITFVEFNPSAK